MNKQAACLLLLIMLSLSLIATVSFGSAQRIQTGVYIKEDGSVQGTSNIQRNADFYIFTGDVTGALHVEKDNVVIDGAGYTLTGGDGRGAVLDNRTGVTLKNTRITLVGGYIVSLSNSKYCTVAGNTLVGTPRTIGKWTDLGPIAVDLLNSQGIKIFNNSISKFFYGLSLTETSGNIITDNILTDGVLGIHMSNASSCVFRNNRLTDCRFGSDGYFSYNFENDLDTSNTVDGKPIYYLVNAKDMAIPKDAANIVLVKCRNILIEGISPHGISLFSTSNTTIANVNLTEDNDCLDVIGCSAINIVNNTFRNGGIAIRITNSSETRVVGNLISNYITRGIAISFAVDTVVYGNTFTNNSYAVAGYQDDPSQNSIIVANTFRNNSYALGIGAKSTVYGNVFENNAGAIIFSDTSGNNIYLNRFVDNQQALVFSNASGNAFYLNSFIDNQRLVSDNGVNVTSAYWIPPPPSINRFDNGTVGNYWSNYYGIDANGDGVGDIAYRVYVNNTDNYPLMAPVSVPTLTQPYVTPIQGTPTNNQSKDSLLLPVENFAVAFAIVLALAVGFVVYYKRHHKTAPQAT